MSCDYVDDTLYAVWGDTRNGEMNIYFVKTIASTNTVTGFSILQGEELAWKIFPNPASSQLRITVEEKLLGQKASIYDTNGKKISAILLSDPLTTIDTRTLPCGAYYLRIGNEGRKFVIE